MSLYLVLQVIVWTIAALLFALSFRASFEGPKPPFWSIATRNSAAIGAATLFAIGEVAASLYLLTH